MARSKKPKAGISAQLMPMKPTVPSQVKPKAPALSAALDHIAVAHYVRPGQLYLRFADDFEGTWTFDQLGLNMSNMKSTTVKASGAGTHLEVQSKWGESVQLDSSSLRVLVDPKYAAEIEKKLDILARRIGL
jgi:hypothetical protein